MPHQTQSVSQTDRLIVSQAVVFFSPAVSSSASRGLCSESYGVCDDHNCHLTHCLWLTLFYLHSLLFLLTAWHGICLPIRLQLLFLLRSQVCDFTAGAQQLHEIIEQLSLTRSREADDERNIRT